MASVKIILLEDVENLGLAGEEVKVAAGYARNYLLPQGKATKVTKGALRQVEARREQIEAQRKTELDAAQALAKQLEEVEISIAMQASEDDTLFGSVTNRVIAEALAEKGIEIDSRRILLEDHIKTLGKFPVDVKLPRGVKSKLNVWVVRR
jgi:large subunit ribosomal protein L9